MVNYRIVPEDNEFRVRIYDAPARRWRALFAESGGQIGVYLHRDQALAGVKSYDRADKEHLFEAELEVYLESARTGKALAECGLPSLVRFGDHDSYL